MWNPISALYTIAPWRTTSTQRNAASLIVPSLEATYGAHPSNNNLADVVVGCKDNTGVVLSITQSTPMASFFRKLTITSEAINPTTRVIARCDEKDTWTFLFIAYIIHREMTYTISVSNYNPKTRFHDFFRSSIMYCYYSF